MAKGAKLTLGDYWEEEPSAEGKEEGDDAAIEAAAGEGEEESIAGLAKKTGASDPVALVKLIRKMIETC